MSNLWPSIPLDAWRDTRETIHRYAQIVGKIQLALTPVVNHFWNVPFRITARGLATSALVYDGRTFDIELDFVEHRTEIRTNDGKRATVDLRPLAVADFYRELMYALGSLDVRVTIWDHPVELRSEAIPFTEDRVNRAYDRAAVERFFRALSSAATVIEQFRARFMGKCSGVGFYWGTFDVAVARYTGRRVPETPTGTIEREAYSHELSEVGFWPGDALHPAPAFFAMHYPEPPGYARATLRPTYAAYAPQSHCFVLPYEQLRLARDPAIDALAFFQSSYEAGATLANWNRSELERHTPRGVSDAT